MNSEKTLENMKKYIGIYDDPKKSIKKTGLIGIILLTSLHLIEAPIIITISLPIMETVLLPLYLYIKPKYQEKKTLREMEEELVPLLYYSSSVARYSNTDEVLRKLSQGNGKISKEFKRTYSDLKRGTSMKKALEDMEKRIPSKIVKRAVKVMVIGHETGADLSKALEEIAEEATQLTELKRERAVASTIEKYTLLLAGGLIVPILLGSLTSVINSLELTSIANIGLGLSEGIKESIRQNTLIGNQIYISLYSIISSTFVAYQEKEIEKALIYIMILLPASLILFNVTKTLNILNLF